jgi:hypothetical protein
MIRTITYALLSVLIACPAQAGYGTIRETDKVVVIEYSGDENDKLAGRLVKEEEQKQEMLVAKKRAHKEDLDNMKQARRAEDHKDNE